MKKYTVMINGEEKKFAIEDILTQSTGAFGTDLIVVGSFLNSIEMVQDGLASDDFNINLQNSLGETPLHFAANQGHLNIVKLLLKNGAQFIPDDEGLYPEMPRELEDLEIYFYDVIRGKEEINILRSYKSVDDIIADFDNIKEDLFIYNDEDFEAVDNLQKFDSEEEIIEDLTKTLKWKMGVVQEEIEKL